MKKLISLFLAFNLLIPPCFSATTNNAINNSGSFAPGVMLTGVSYPRIHGALMASGDNDLYTVPTGKRLIVFAGRCYNSTGSSITAIYKVKISATYYVMAANTTCTNGTDGTLTLSAYILNAGESVSINTSAQDLDVTINGILYDATVPMYSVHVTSLSTGDNTIYTVPSGKTAYIVDSVPSTTSPNPFVCGTIRMRNEAGGSRTITGYVVASGQSSGSGYQVREGVSISDSGFLTLTSCSNMNAGDFVVVNTSSGTGTQRVWLNVIEA